MENKYLQTALQQGVLTQDTYDRIIGYRRRLEENNVPVIYNLRHVRKILRIQKKEQGVFFGEEKRERKRQ